MRRELICVRNRPAIYVLSCLYKLHSPELGTVSEFITDYLHQFGNIIVPPQSRPADANVHGLSANRCDCWLLMPEVSGAETEDPPAAETVPPPPNC